MILKFLTSAAILALRISLAWRYLLRPASVQDCDQRSAFGDRPWRRLGAGIAGVVALMFVVGAYAVDIPDRPWPYAFYWLIVMGMVLWLAALAVKDLRHTRRIARQLHSKLVRDRLDLGRPGGTE